jgi:CheY-like chemotaxis protein
MDRDDGNAGRQSARHSSTSAAMALVVGSSAVNRVVLARIVEQSGLRAAQEAPSGALAALGREPVLLVLDGGRDGRECDPVIAEVAAMRNRGLGTPLVVLLADHAARPDITSEGRGVDAVASMPIMPEKLHPLIERLLDRVR